MTDPREELLATVLRRLGREKGNLRRISEETGVPYPTLTKISSGAVTDPRVSTAQTLFNYFAGRPEQAAAAESAYATH
jgi:predicted transcriptional regulator